MAIKKIKHKKLLSVYKAYFEGDGRELCFLEKPKLTDLITAFKVKNPAEVTGAAFTVSKLNLYTKRKLQIVIHHINHGSN